MKPEFLDRDILRSPYDLVLCTTAAQLAQVQKRAGIRPDELVAHPTTGAQATTFSSRCYIVPPTRCMQVVQVAEGIEDDFSSIQIAAVLCHEAVHCAQAIFARLGETAPSDELYAYTVQSITQNLMYEYARQTGRGT